MKKAHEARLILRLVRAFFNEYFPKPTVRNFSGVRHNRRNFAIKVSKWRRFSIFRFSAFFVQKNEFVLPPFYDANRHSTGYHTF